MARLRWLLSRTALALCAFALTIVALEAALRITGYNYSPMTIESRDALSEALPATEADARVLHLFQDDHFTYDYDLLWRPRPGRSVFNSQGYRGPELEPVKKPGERRILALGDSNTLGWSGRSGPNWPQDLGDLMADTEPGFAVVNAGVWGYSAFQGERRFEELRKLEPDLVLVSFGGNDAHPVYLSDADYARRISGPRLLFASGWKIGEVLAAVRDRVGIGGLPAPEPRADELSKRVSIEDYRDHLRRIARAARSDGAVVAFLTRPYRGRSLDERHWRFWAPAYREATREVAESEGALFVDVYGEFKERRELFKDESHFTSLGHRIAAKFIYDRIAPSLTARLGVASEKIIPAGPILAADLAVDFGTRDARRYLRSGFAGKDVSRNRTAVKNNRPRARVELPLAPEAADYALSIEARPFRGGQRVELEVWFNGVEVGRTQVTAPWKEHVFVIPAQSLRQGINRVELVHDGTGGGAVVLYDRLSLQPTTATAAEGKS